jgi:hypothetical protein
MIDNKSINLLKGTEPYNQKTDMTACNEVVPISFKKITKRCVVWFGVRGILPKAFVRLCITRGGLSDA